MRWKQLKIAEVRGRATGEENIENIKEIRDDWRIIIWDFEKRIEWIFISIGKCVGALDIRRKGISSSSGTYTGARNVKRMMDI